MSYEEREISVDQGQPVECFRFERGGRGWLVTSADREIVLPAVGTFEPDAVRAEGQEFRDEDDQGQIEIELPRTSAIVTPYIAGLPAEKTWVTVYRAHRGDEADPICWFSGAVDRVRFRKDSVAVAHCSTILTQLSRRVPGLALMASCNWALYSPECGLDPADYRDSVTVTSVDGSNVTSAGFAARPDGYFTGGWLERSSGDKRFIVAHEGDTVQLIYPMPGLAPPESVGAYRGCDHSRATCLALGNRLQFTGFEWIPRRDPGTQRMMN